jgi:lipopolysaccharide/colanic/teichoic acid biosynthesis glycosyltransferase
MGALTIATRDAGTQPAEALGWRIIALAERGLALVLLLLLSPALLLAAIFTAALSRDSPFVAHARVGRGGAGIRVIKLRTMWGVAPASGFLLLEPIDDSAIPDSKTARDGRVTSAFAHFCRRYSIDEIPQLWQVVCGRMALIGPRPVTAQEMRSYYRLCADEVLSVPPGISGLWQVTGRSSLTYRQRRMFDLFLVRKRTLGLYVFILAKTVTAVLTGRNAT